jgi:excisionase family DNA binding protein
MARSATASPPIDFADLILAPDLYGEMQVSRKTIFTWIQERGFPRPMVVGKTRYFSRSEISAWLKTRRRPRRGRPERGDNGDAT